MDQNCLASLIQRVYRIIFSADDPANLLSSFAEVLAEEPNNLLIWFDAIGLNTRAEKIYFSQKINFHSKDIEIISEKIQEGKLLSENQFDSQKQFISSLNSNESFRFVNTYFGNSTSTGILSLALEHTNQFYGYLNVIVGELDHLTAELSGLLQELCKDIGIKIYQLKDEKFKKESDHTAFIKAKESINFKNYLLGNINHEIRTPLNAILGFAQILKEENDKETVEMLADKILFASNRLLSTLDSIIELSDLQSDNRKLQYSDFSIFELLKVVQHKFRTVAQEKNLLFEVIEPDQDVIIKSDEYLLKKILIQLLDNAFKYTQNGSVTLSVRFNINENDNWLVVDVSDTGIGIEQDKIDTIFEAFRQGSEGLSRSYQGTGLGLTLTKKMIELLNGKICVESEKGMGSTFSVHIPFEFPESEYKVFVKNNGSHVFDGKRILVVEDNELNAEVLKHYLKTVVTTDFASDAKETFDLVSKNFYNLILLDISLKDGESGIDVMKKIKNTGKYNDVPIVALTAYTFDEDKNKFLREGFDGFIPKPIKRDELIKELKKVIA